MSEIDLVFSVGIFILFFGITMVLIVSFFLKGPITIPIEEFREKASNLFDALFSSEGSPRNWEDTGQTPSELGLVKTIYRIPIIVKENNQTSRTNEPIIKKILFDDSCTGDAYNSTIRLYDDDMNSITFGLNNSVLCTSGFLNESYIRFLVNMAVLLQRDGHTGRL
jgi:hypothetical protein